MLSLDQKNENSWDILKDGKKAGQIQLDSEAVSWEILPAFWGQGLAVEAGLIVRHIALHERKMPQLLHHAKDDYDACIARRLGMIRMQGQTYNVERIQIIPYDPKWPKVFEAEIKKLSFLPATFHHIGSTSIEGCAAKPIIDILGETHKLEEIDAFNQKMEDLGYILLGEFRIPKRRFFRKRKQPFVHLHIFEKGNSEIARHLRFRDQLRKDPKKVAEYVKLKQHLTKSDASNMELYLNGKEDFVRALA